MLVRDDNVMQFGSKQVVSHFWQLSDNLYFSEYFFALVQTVKNILNQLNCIDLSGLQVLSPNDLAKATFAEQLEDLVLVGNKAPNGRQVNLVGPFHD